MRREGASVDIRHKTQVSSLKSQVSVLHGQTIGFIGAGKMGQALIKGLRSQGVPASSIMACDVDAKTLEAVRRQFGVKTGTSVQAVRRSDILVLAVKPQQFPEVISAIARSVTQQKLVISIAAGITLRWLSSRLKKASLVRVMPNLPATVGCGFSALTFGKAVSKRHRAVAKALFEAVGAVVELPEKQFNAITAISGSGPAYVFFLVDAWQQAAKKLKLPPTVAKKAIEQTLLGSVALLGSTDDTAAMLMSKVASKGGTTEAALKVLANRRVQLSFSAALAAAARRSRQLSWS